MDIKIKDELKYNDKRYLLLSMYEDALLPETSVANIVAVDKDDNLIWTVEPPTTKYDIYARIYLKEDKLFAASSAGQIDEIDKQTGKVITSKMVK